MQLCSTDTKLKYSSCINRETLWQLLLISVIVLLATLGLFKEAALPVNS